LSATAQRAPAGLGAPGAEWLAAFAIALSFVAGATDVWSFMRLGEVFTSVMTGNLVLLGMGVGTAIASQVLYTAVALAGYLAGTALGARLAAPPGGSHATWPRTVTVALAVELAVFLALLAGWNAVGTRPGEGMRVALLAGAALAMGMQSAATRQVRVDGLSTTYFTSTLLGVVEGIALPGREVRLRSVLQLVALAAGACVSAVLITHAAPFAPVLQCGLLAAVIIVARTRPGLVRPRPDEAGTTPGTLPRGR
jgi:uncharacterized membrane protein YoaK (UPF0700 family)